MHAEILSTQWESNCLIFPPSVIQKQIIMGVVSCTIPFLVPCLLSYHYAVFTLQNVRGSGEGSVNDERKSCECCSSSHDLSLNCCHLPPTIEHAGSWVSLYVVDEEMLTQSFLRKSKH